MGTRGFIGFVASGRETITYNHYDSYPSGLGVVCLDFARKMASSEDVREIAAIFAFNIQHVSDAVAPTAADIAKLQKYTDLNVSNRSLTDWYCLLRGTQGDPEKILDAGYSDHDPDWPLDSLFCEWGYLFNFDTCEFEVYRGFQTVPPDAGRWVGRTRERPGDYYAVQQVAVYPMNSLKALPTEAELILIERADDE